MPRKFNVEGVPKDFVDDGPWALIARPLCWVFVQGGKEAAIEWLEREDIRGSRQIDEFPSLEDATNGARRLYPGCVGETIMAKSGQEYQLLDLERFMVYAGMRLVFTKEYANAT